MQGELRAAAKDLGLAVRQQNTKEQLLQQLEAYAIDNEAVSACCRAVQLLITVDNHLRVWLIHPNSCNPTPCMRKQQAALPDTIRADT